MKILDRLVAGSFLKLFVLSILATPPLFILGELTENLDDYVDQGLTMTEVAHGFVYRLPEYIVWSFPIAALIAVVFTVHGMTTHREVVAAKAGGVSFHRLLFPVGLLGLLLTGVALGLTDLAPRSNEKANQILKDEDPRREWRANFVYRTESGLAVASGRLMRSEGRLEGVLVLREGEPGVRPAVHIEASSARYDTLSGHWTFENGHLRMVYEQGELADYAFQGLRLPDFTERPGDLLETPPEDDEMTYAEIGRLADIIERSGGESHELRVKREQKIAIPVATFVIILFGAPMATSSKRGGAAYGIGVALGTTILYMLLFKVAGGFGASGSLDPKIAAWMPNVIFLLAGTVLLARVRT